MIPKSFLFFGNPRIKSKWNGDNGYIGIEWDLNWVPFDWNGMEWKGNGLVAPVINLFFKLEGNRSVVYTE